MIDALRVRRKLAALENYVDRLDRIVPEDLKTYSKADILVKGATERNLQLISDTELDILVHIHRNLELDLAGDDDSVMERMGKRLSGGAIEKIKWRRDLRNRLIHAYTDGFYDKDAFEQARSLADVTEFRREILKLLQKENGAGQ